MMLNVRPRILAVDDLEDNLDLIREVFADEPYEIVTAGDAETALELARTAPPDVAILDVQMPEVDGYELCRLLHNALAPDRIPVLFLTAQYTTPGDAVHGLDAGAYDYVTKPFDADVLRARVRAACRMHAERANDIAAAKKVTRRLQGR